MFRWLHQVGSGHTPARRRASVRPCLEVLEDRQTPTVVSLAPRADDTLYQDPAGQLSNGAGQHFYVGDTAQAANGIRRGILAFDLSAVPAGSVIHSATLMLHMSLTKGGAQDVTVHRTLRNWGEGTSNAAGGSPGSGEGDGAQAASRDVTWLYTFFNTARWATAGGDFAATVSTSTSVNGVGSYQWTGSGITADVQQWVDHPTTNFGWILTGDEAARGNAKHFDTRENTNPANRPTLVIDFSPGGSIPVPDLTIRQAPIGAFSAGGTGAYAITVTNVGTAATAGEVTVRDVLSAGLSYASPTSINGWTISINQQTITATRADPLVSHASYPALVVTVKFASDVPTRVTNTVTVAGGGELNMSNDVATIITAIVGPKQLQRRRGA
jgi:uncharacterized repeat protein (TIGR01451 family)